MSSVTPIGVPDWRLQAADDLEAIARELREGKVDADVGLVLLRSQATGKLQPPRRIGSPSYAIDLIGLCHYGAMRLYALDIDPPA